MANEDIQSNIINLLRFVLIVSVVFMHNYGTTIKIDGEAINVNNLNYPIFYTTSLFFAKIIGGLRVPFFFMISGYFFFYKINFNEDIYKQKIKKRIKSLLIPYLYWNATCLLGFSLFDLEYNLVNVLRAFWNLVEFGGWYFPAAYQFWFVRDLIVISLLSPLVYLYVKYLKIPGLILLCFCWIYVIQIPYIGRQGLKMDAVFFFSLGAWFSLHRKILLEEFEKYKKISYVFFVLFTMADLYTQMFYKYIPLIHQTNVLLGIISFFNLAKWIIVKKDISISKSLSSASFFLFAIHEPWMLKNIKNYIFETFKPQSDLFLTFLFFLIPAIVTGLCLGLFYLGMELIPTFMNIITGGRKKKAESIVANV